MSTRKLSSTELLHHCVKKGLLSKEAADRVQQHRKELVKEAWGRWAAQLLREPMDKEAGFWGDLKKGLSRGGIKGKPKNAGYPSTWGDTLASFGKMFGLGASFAGGGAALDYGLSRMQGGVKDSDIKQSFKVMLQEFPELIQERNPNIVKAHFGVLQQYAPDIAANPIVAGSFVKETTRQGGVHVANIKQIVDAQRSISEAKGGRIPSDRIEKGIRAATAIV